MSGSLISEIKVVSEDLVTMNAQDLRDMLKGCQAGDIYKAESGRLRVQMLKEQQDRERDRYIAAGLGLCLGIFITK